MIVKNSGEIRVSLTHSRREEKRGEQSMIKTPVYNDRERLRVSAVIPTLNEAQNLYYVLPFIPPIVTEVILVDGHSTDDTVAVAKQLLPTIKVVYQTGKGKGDALRAGVEACQGDIILLLDSDGSTDPNEIPRFVEALLRGFDYVKGSRYLQGGGSYDLTLLRRLGNYFLCNFVNFLFRTRSSDLCYGYNAFWRHCLEHVAIDCDGFEIETHLYLRMCKAQLKIAEVPSIENKRIYGSSNLNALKDGFRILHTIIQERLSAPTRPTPRPQYATLALAKPKDALSQDVAILEHEDAFSRNEVLIPEQVMV